MGTGTKLHNMWREQLAREHHSSWTWAHAALEQVLRELDWPEVEWRQTGADTWEATSGHYRLRVYQSSSGGWSWAVSVVGPHAHGTAGSMPDALAAAEGAAR